MGFRMRYALLALTVVVCLPTFALAEEGHELLVHPISILPFALLLLSIAILPLAAGHFWHKNSNKLIVALGISVPVLAYLIYLGAPGVHGLTESLLEYVQFIALLASLYTVSGNIVLEGDLDPSPKVNIGLLALGAVLANLIGTTGASMLLIRPYLKINARRQFKGHLPVFFIFIVSNLGGLLTPLGDPPLFLGFLRGIDFFWTLNLWPQWLVGIGVVLAIFAVWEFTVFRKERTHGLENVPGVGRLRVLGSHNFAFLAGILAVILSLSPELCAKVGMPAPAVMAANIVGSDPASLTPPLSAEIVRVALFVGPLLLLSALSLLTTPAQLRKENDFSWGAIIEVAVLFIGIFITMVPALALLKVHGGELGINTPATFFWATGILSSFLDNAPTYLTFATVAAEGQPFATLMTTKPLILQAISVGAVFMGANTYIGNGPNFMVKAIADEAGYETPSFFGYMVYSGLILLPTFALITYLFFMP
jgi:Na+/H+ antiporter NhaD/arsenite permease-like protein